LSSWDWDYNKEHVPLFLCINWFVAHMTHHTKYSGSNLVYGSFFSFWEMVSSARLTLRIVSWLGTGSEVSESERVTGPEVTESAKQKSDSWSKIST
jgi:hypothetical protein